MTAQKNSIQYSRKLRAGSAFPNIELPNFEGGIKPISAPENGCDWKLIVIYRGKHCPICTKYLNQLEALKAQFYNNNVDIIAVSADSKEQVAEHMQKLEVSFPIAYDLNIEQMQSLGLYISNPRSDQETDHLFAEPGLFVINKKGNIQVMDISNAPFARPDLEALSNGLVFIRDPQKNYPIRGTHD